MIICLCKGVSDRTISGLVDRGVTQFRSMQNLCDVGRGCGKCIQVVKNMIDNRTGILPHLAYDSHDGCLSQIREFYDGKVREQK